MWSSGPSARAGSGATDSFPGKPALCAVGLCSVQVGESLTGGFQFGFEGGDPGGLLGARLLDDLVYRDGEVLVQFLCGAGDRGGRNGEVAGQIGGALLELGAPFAVGGAGDGECQLESLGLLAGCLLGRGFLRLLLGSSFGVGCRRSRRRGALDGRDPAVRGVGVGGRRFRVSECLQSSVRRSPPEYRPQ